MNRRHATCDYTRSASYIFSLVILKLAISFQSQIRKIAYVAEGLVRIPRLLLRRALCHGGKRFCPFGPTAAIFRPPPMSKINVPRIAFLETGLIIALPPPESNRKEQSAKPLGGGSALPCANPSPPMAQPCLPWVKEKSAPDERNVGYG